LIPARLQEQQTPRDRWLLFVLSDHNQAVRVSFRC